MVFKTYLISHVYDIKKYFIVPICFVIYHKYIYFISFIKYHNIFHKPWIICHVMFQNWITSEFHTFILYIYIYIYICVCVRVCDFHIWKEQHMTHIVYHISFLKIHAYNTCIYIYIYMYYICLFNYLHATCSCKFRTCTNTSILPKHQNTHTIIYIYVCVYYCKLYIKKHHLTGAKRREWMGCWGLLGSLFIVIMDHSRKFAAKNQ